MSSLPSNYIAALLNEKKTNYNAIRSRRFKSFTGLSMQTFAVLYKLVTDVEGISKKWLFVTLYFLKSYPTESLLHLQFRCDEKTLRKWIWKLLEKISNLNLVKWSNRIHGKSFHGCLASVDGTDVRIREPQTFDPKWYSHKFHGPGVRYEVGVSISTADIVWVSGPYPSGSYPDISIFNLKMVKALIRNERVVADNGYKSKYCLRSSQLVTCCDIQKHKRIRARHESINGRLKKFNILNVPFRHSLIKHNIVFFAIANIVQLEIEMNGNTFEV